MLNLKAFTWATAISTAVAFTLLVVYSRMMPVFTSGTAFGIWLADLRMLTCGGFMLRLSGAGLVGAVSGLLVGIVINGFNRLLELLS